MEDLVHHFARKNAFFFLSDKTSQETAKVTKEESRVMKHHWPKIIEWSEVDEAFVGSIPGLADACCHGADEQTVLEELCEIEKGWLDIFKDKGRQPPPSLPPLYMFYLSADHPLLRNLDPRQEAAKAFAWLDEGTREHEAREAEQSLATTAGVQKSDPSYRAR